MKYLFIQYFLKNYIDYFKFDFNLIFIYTYFFTFKNCK